MRGNLIKKIGVSIGITGFCLGMMLGMPSVSLTAQAAKNVPGATVQAHIIDYAYKIENRKLYKRLYNYSTGEFIGDWIFVRNLTDEDLAFWGLI